MILADDVAAKMAVNLFRAEVDEALDAQQAHRFHEMERAFDVDAEGSQWRAGGGGHTDDCRTMDNGVRPCIPQCMHDVGPLGDFAADGTYGRESHRGGVQRRTLRNVEGPDLIAPRGECS